MSYEGNDDDIPTHRWALPIEEDYDPNDGCDSADDWILIDPDARDDFLQRVAWVLAPVVCFVVGVFVLWLLSKVAGRL